MRASHASGLSPCLQERQGDLSRTHPREALACRPRAVLSSSNLWDTDPIPEGKGETEPNPAPGCLPPSSPSGRFSASLQNLLLGVLPRYPRPQSFLPTLTSTAHTSLCKGSKRGASSLQLRLGCSQYMMCVCVWQWGRQLDLPQSSEHHRTVQLEETK